MRIDIEYNTERPQITYPEYGRSIHEMIIQAKFVDHDQYRQRMVEEIVSLMMVISPSSHKNVEDYRDKLWNHVFAIANYELEVTPPMGVVIRREEDRPKVEPVGYPASSTRMRHYGNSVHLLIQKAIAMPEGTKKEGFVEVIASYMKLAYKTWNKEHYVSDDIVKDDLEFLSDGKLLLHEGHDSLDKLAAGATHQQDRRSTMSNTGKRNNNNNRNNRPNNNMGGSGRNSNNNNRGGNISGNFKNRKK